MREDGNPDSTPLISVIIPNYNYGHYLFDCISSVLNQSYKNIEIIVVDDGSTDQSVEIVQKFEQVKLIRKQNGGVSSARNKGIQECEGEYICFLDSDDVWLPTKLERQMQICKRNSSDIVYSSIYLCDEKLNATAIQYAEYRGDIHDQYVRYPSKALILLGCSSALFSRSLLDKVGNFDTTLSIAADWDFFRRLAKLSDVEFVDEPLVKYRQHSDSMSSGALKKYLSDNKRAIKKLRVEIDNNYEKAFLTRKFTISKIALKFFLLSQKSKLKYIVSRN